MSKIPGYMNGSGGEDESWKDDNPESKNPTGRKRRSSAKKRRQHDNKLFKGTPWGKKDDDKK